MGTANEQSEESATDYWQIRKEIRDLHPSETVFLHRILFPGAKVLDVGCASGGFFNIMKTMEPLMEYTGVDIAEPPIRLAKQNYPGVNFQVIDGIEMPFEDNTFDIVHCTKVLVIEPRYQEMVKEMYRVSKRFVLIDIRLIKDIGNENVSQQSSYKIEFTDDRADITLPYMVHDADEVADFILQLNPKPEALRGTGYFHDVADEAETPYREVCMTMLLLQKGNSETGESVVDLRDLPIEFSASRA
jgi:ubiquinone/menaquinone biosynthesis C-methylase UbiE